jgi:2-polyprenyl-3-methyl-5-hydroxy-6-metoxy-1,4-benzoquinol methylase
MLRYLLRKFHIPTPFTGYPVSRQQSCRVCGSMEASGIAETDFWDLQHAEIVKCNNCGHIQLDPMLTDEATETGCNAYWIEELVNTSLKEQERNLVRNYRRGILFASMIRRKGFSPAAILELGPGSGYFSAGIRFIFPECKVTVVDIVDDVLRNNKEVHSSGVFKGTPEKLDQLGTMKFDLIIARDILEHVTDISKVIGNVVNHLNENGLFLFITPNGHEDVWGHYVCRILYQKPSELLINHVNYFDGAGLLSLLQKKGFSPLSYYTYQVKTTIRGKGWSVKPKLAATVSTKRSAEEIMKIKDQVKFQHGFDKDKILKSWLFHTRFRWITVLYCWYHHFSLVRLSPKLNVGHEIFGLFIKK